MIDLNGSSQLRPIQTAYNGYRFRSRLEARWAVFFDQLQVPYLYESEGFVVRGKHYLPDFYLPEQMAFVEIKPTLKGANTSLMLLQGLLAGQVHQGFLVGGTPSTNPEDYMVATAHNVLLGYMDDEPLIGPLHGWWENAGPRRLGVSEIPNHDARIAAALLQARGARFEHGERGRW